MAQDKVSIRISKEDMQKFNTLASSLSMTKTAVIKKIVHDGFGKTVEVTNAEFLTSLSQIQKMLVSFEEPINKLSVNMNQIAKKINSGEKFTDADRQILTNDFAVLEKATARFEALSELISTRTKKTVIKKRGSK
ncbi:mobilization protein [Pseudomonas synxantha]|uniref:Mobilization protein n=1 Tax=Pseudomonas synxantha TaxID=47883 RepID=A0A5D3G5P6_9PSED|nr:mobilization protein [Pseudomonas synxantha]TYK55789.1 mobilization protein [Pseudomonas synxantha]